MDPTRPHDGEKNTHTHTQTRKVRGEGQRWGGTEKNMKLVATVEFRRWGGEGRGRSQQLETATKWAVGVGSQYS